MPDPEIDDETILDSVIGKLSDVFDAVGQKFTYVYDFGDNWNHSISL
jgi:hypothetical protein